jgi:hypothetical protein
MDHLELDGNVTCRSCGIDQAFMVQGWTEILEGLHGLADLSGSPDGRNPHPRLAIGAVNPHREIGKQSATVDWKNELEGEDGVKQVLRVEAAPGHTVCPAGHGPMRVRAGGDVHVSCETCGIQQQYSRLSSSPYDRLTVVLADHNRLDAKAARPGTRDGLDGFSCPGCGAPLPVEEGRALVTCSFCHLTSKVPTGKGRIASTVPPALWWMLFEGPSPLRRRLERSPVGSARSLEEAPLRTGRDPLGASLRWGPWLILPSIALALSGILFWFLVQRGWMSPEWVPQ